MMLFIFLLYANILVTIIYFLQLSLNIHIYIELKQSTVKMLDVDTCGCCKSEEEWLWHGAERVMMRSSNVHRLPMLQGNYYSCKGVVCVVKEHHRGCKVVRDASQM